jgi:CelD/BcsL family acetyltransferase involved in cellulose biosynthesis
MNKIISMNDSYLLSTFYGENGFNELKNDWEELWNRSQDASQFQRWDWQYYYYKYLLVLLDPVIIVVRNEEGSCVALVAFCKVKDPVSGLHKVAFLGDLAADYHMILCQPGLPIELGHLIFDYFYEKSTWNASIYEISNIPQGSWTEKVITTYLEKRNFPPELLVQKISQAYAIALPDNLDSYLDLLGTRSRRDYFYDRRRLEKDFSTKWQIYHENSNIDQCLSDIQIIDKARWQKDSQYFDRKKIDFFLSYSRTQAADDVFLAYILYINGKPASYVAGAVVKNKYIVARIAYDPAIAPHLSIGKITNFYAIEQCISKGYTEYDLTRGSENYKKWLNATPHNNYHARLYRSNFDKILEAGGRNALSILRNQTWLRRVYQKYFRK